MGGMNAQTGRRMDDIDHLRQSMSDILTTPIGSRVHRRTYGSDLFNLIDQPSGEATRLRIYAATADALARWEPRISINKVVLTVNENGQAEVDVEGEYRPGGRVTGEIIVVKGVRV